MAVQEGGRRCKSAPESPTVHDKMADIASRLASSAASARGALLEFVTVFLCLPLPGSTERTAGCGSGQQFVMIIIEFPTRNMLLVSKNSVPMPVEDKKIKQIEPLSTILQAL